MVTMDKDNNGLQWTKNSQNRAFYGKLAVDFIATDQLLIPNGNLRIKLVRNQNLFWQLKLQTQNFRFNQDGLQFFTVSESVDTSRFFHGARICTHFNSRRINEMASQI